eukprot:4023781-Heterocapsa_arctica.AAC.1
MELVVYLENSLQMRITEESSEQEDTESTNITETEMHKAIKGIEKNMEQLQLLHNKSDDMSEQMKEITNMVNTIRG